MSYDNENDVALFDMDGTLAGYEEVLTRDMRSLLAPGEELSMDDSLPYVKARMRIIKGQPGWWLSLPKLRDGFEILGLAKALRFRICVLTKGPYMNVAAWSEKVAWCRQSLDNDTQVTITEDKGLVYGKVLVDDFPDYMERWLEHRPRGLGIMPERPINKGFKHPNVVKYDGTNLDEIAARLKKAKER